MTGPKTTQGFDDVLSTLFGGPGEPMPDGFMEVPDAWIERGPSVLARNASLLLRATAVGLTAVAAVFVALALTGRPAQPAGMTLAEAATTLGVPPAQVVKTLDGYVAVRERGGMLQVVLGRIDGSRLTERLLVEVGIPIIPRSQWTVAPVSCKPSSGIRQPNFVFGPTAGVLNHVGPIPSNGVRLSFSGMSGVGSNSDDYFIFVLDDAYPDSKAVLHIGGPGGASVQGWAFLQNAPCGADDGSPG